MTLIAYLTRTHFADGAIDDALPEEAAGVERAVALTDGEPGAAEALEQIRGALPRVSLQAVDAGADAPCRQAAMALADHMRRVDAATLIAVGGAGAVGQARLLAEDCGRRGVACRIFAAPVALFDLGLARHVRPSGGAPAPVPRPDGIILDPTLLVHAPPRRLAAAGMKLLVHAIEAYANPGFNPPADGLALDAVRRLTRALPALAEGPADAALRRELLSAAMSAGLAMEKAVGGVDALAGPLAEALGGETLPGELHAAVFAAFVDFNARAVGERYPALLDAMGPGAMGEDCGPGGLAARLAGLARRLGLPASLRETATDRAGFERVARLAADDPAALANPRLLTPGDCRRILDAAW